MPAMNDANEALCKSLSLLLSDTYSSKDIFELLNTMSIEDLIATLNKVGLIDGDINFYRQAIIGEVAERISRKMFLKNNSTVKSKILPSYVSNNTFMLELRRIAVEFSALMSAKDINASHKSIKIADLHSQVIALLASPVVFNDENAKVAWSAYRKLSATFINYLERRKFQGLVAQ